MNCDLGTSVTSCRLGVTAVGAGLTGMGAGKSKPSKPSKNEAVEGVGLACCLSVVVVVGGGVEVVVTACLGLAVTTPPLTPPRAGAPPPCLAGKDLNLLLDLGLSSTFSAGAGRPLALTRILLLSPLCLALVLTPSSSLLSSCISLIAALASSARPSSSTAAATVSSSSSGSLAVARSALRAGEAWDRRNTLEVVASSGLLTTRCLTFCLSGSRKSLLVVTSSTSGLLVVDFLKLILTI